MYIYAFNAVEKDAIEMICMEGAELPGRVGNPQDFRFRMKDDGVMCDVLVDGFFIASFQRFAAGAPVIAQDRHDIFNCHSGMFLHQFP